jgi:hypothetical protein
MALLGLSACIILPIPTPEWGDAPYSQERLAALENGVGTVSGDDIIAELGNPWRTFAGDRIFVYSWTIKQGIWIYGVANQGGVSAGESHHRLGLLFDESGVLAEVRHVDSALFDSDRRTRAVLDDWIEQITNGSSDLGYTERLDIEAFLQREQVEPAATVGIMSINGNGQPSPCQNEFEQMLADGYEVYTLADLRDRFYPWLEQPWTSNLETLATSLLVDKQRRATGLRFIVVADSSSGFPEQDFCSPGSNYGISCYHVDSDQRLSFAAILDLDTKADPHTITASPPENIPLIPHFPNNEHEACRTLMAYALRDIESRVK